MANPILGAIQSLASEKNIPSATILETVEAALAAAYRKDFGQKNQNIKVEFDPKTGVMKVFDVKTVCADALKAEWDKEQAEREAVLARGEELPPPPPPVLSPEGVPLEEEPKFNPRTLISLSDAVVIKADAKLDEEIRVELPIPGEFGRMAAQTAKQVIIQRLREAERTALTEEYETKVGTLVTGTVQRPEGRNLTVDLGNIIAYLPPEEQALGERYRIGIRLRFYLVAVNKTGKGPMVVVSRAHSDLVRELFTSEVPEVQNGVVKIKAIAREAGSRTKVAVVSLDESIDPIGACVGQRGTRVQTIIRELGGEKIDIILADEDPVVYVANALAPAKVEKIELDVASHNVRALVPQDQVPLAIGRGGQNVRLAARLTGWRIDIVPIEKPAEVVASSEITPEEAAKLEAASAPQITNDQAPITNQ